MSKVFNVHVTHKDGHLDMKVFSLGGEFCSADLPGESTLQDTVDALKPQLGCPKVNFDIFVENELVVDPLQPAPLTEQFTMNEDSFQFMMKEDSFGPCRKFLAALSKKAFLPESEHFDVKWTQKEQPDVDQEEVAPFLERLGSSNREEDVRFMRVFGRLTCAAESWECFNLQLQELDPMLKGLKHALCEHWLQVARNAVKQKVSSDPGPLFLPVTNYNKVMGIQLLSADNSFPPCFDRKLVEFHKTCMGGISPTHRLSQVLGAVVSLEWDDDPAARVERCERRCSLDKKDIVLEPGPTPEDVVKMAHVFLLLSCNAEPVEVEHRLPFNLVQCVATSLGWHMHSICYDHEVTDEAIFRATLEEHLKGAIEEAKRSQGHVSGFCSGLTGFLSQSF